MKTLGLSEEVAKLLTTPENEESRKTHNCCQTCYLKCANKKLKRCHNEDNIAN